MALTLILITFVIDSVFSESNCPLGVQILAPGAVICPDQVGAFLCEALDTLTIGWRLNNSLRMFLFIANEDMTGAFFSHKEPLYGGIATAYLLRRDVVSDSNSLSNVTSILHYSPFSDTNGAITIECISNGVACDSTMVQVFL